MQIKALRGHFAYIHSPSGQQVGLGLCQWRIRSPADQGLYRWKGDRVSGRRVLCCRSMYCCFSSNIIFVVEFKRKDNEKLDAIQMEYSFILTSQLECQRLYFEEKLREAEERRVEVEKASAAKVFSFYIYFFLIMFTLITCAFAIHVISIFHTNCLHKSDLKNFSTHSYGCNYYHVIKK